MDGKKAVESFTIMNELVLPNDTNTFGNLMGGRLMYWMDIAAGIAAGKHCNTPSMTASVDHLSFKNPIKLEMRIASDLWYFGNGLTSTLQNATTQYSQEST